MTYKLNLFIVKNAEFKCNKETVSLIVNSENTNMESNYSIPN